MKKLILKGDISSVSIYIIYVRRKRKKREVEKSVVVVRVSREVGDLWL